MNRDGDTRNFKAIHVSKDYRTIDLAAQLIFRGAKGIEKKIKEYAGGIHSLTPWYTLVELESITSSADGFAQGPGFASMGDPSKDYNFIGDLEDSDEEICYVVLNDVTFVLYFRGTQNQVLKTGDFKREIIKKTLEWS